MDCHKEFATPQEIDLILWSCLGNNRPLLLRYWYGVLMRNGLSKREYWDDENHEKRHAATADERRVRAREIRSRESA